MIHSCPAWSFEVTREKRGRPLSSAVASIISTRTAATSYAVKSSCRKGRIGVGWESKDGGIEVWQPQISDETDMSGNKVINRRMAPSQGKKKNKKRR